uniref:EF-hand domain-containing protein n=1 Tax=Chromera velia CCMP2878 TaxID=1169474 RepID=A0A0G4HAF0_9ALVE|eukprot:Cvel_903.t1-p1 / transcript=Cvel_903.t1 / gene=Cvel_903 / organism=Chromera_velia_CCMP2878 / gene_product=hypothetical protein / transcript_product=hypothetical protein / location=Cvel_scaffold28:144183-146758(-) / protein_length=255 / sequence_SO=supercontig / SO=protein_coding / is_pseudo=false
MRTCFVGSSHPMVLEYIKVFGRLAEHAAASNREVFSTWISLPDRPRPRWDSQLFKADTALTQAEFRSRIKRMVFKWPLARSGDVLLGRSALFRSLQQKFQTTNGETAADTEASEVKSSTEEGAQENLIGGVTDGALEEGSADTVVRRSINKFLTSEPVSDAVLSVVFRLFAEEEGSVLSEAERNSIRLNNPDALDGILDREEFVRVLDRYAEDEDEMTSGLDGKPYFLVNIGKTMDFEGFMKAVTAFEKRNSITW